MYASKNTASKGLLWWHGDKPDVGCDSRRGHREWSDTSALAASAQKKAHTDQIRDEHIKETVVLALYRTAF